MEMVAKEWLLRRAVAKECGCKGDLLLRRQGVKEAGC